MAPYSAEGPRSAPKPAMPPPRRTIPAIPLAMERSAQAKRLAAAAAKLPKAELPKSQEPAPESPAPSTSEPSNSASLPSTPYNISEPPNSSGAAQLPTSLQSSPATSSSANAAGEQAETSLPIANGIMPPSPTQPTFPPTFHPGHSYHNSAQNINMPPPGFTAAPYQQSQQHFNPEAIFMPRLNMDSPHAMSRSGSYSSAYPTPDRDQFTAQQSPIHINMAHIPVTVDLDAAMALKDYSSSQFGNGEFADFVMEISEFNAQHSTIFIPIHGLIIARSPMLHALIQKQSSQPLTHPDGLKALCVQIKDKFLPGHAFVEALQYLYGMPLLNPNELIQGLSPFRLGEANLSNSSPVLQRMSQALAQASAGHFLQLPVIALHAVHCAKRLLRWDTVEKALSFALDGGLTHEWQSRSHSPSAVSSDVPDIPLPTPTYGELGGHLVQYIIDFLVYSFPTGFQFCSSAPQLIEAPRLPTIIENRPAAHHPRLSLIQFGDMSLEGIGRPDFVTMTLSSILVSLPFPLLKALLEQFNLSGKLGVPRLHDITRQVVREREIRRLKVVKSQRVAYSGDHRLSEELKWTEAVIESNHHASGFELARSWIGPDNITPNGATNDSTTSQAKVPASPADSNPSHTSGDRDPSSEFGLFVHG